MDPVALEKAFELYPDVKTVVIAHLYGTPGKIDEPQEICSRYGAVIIEDAAESLGLLIKKEKQENLEQSIEDMCTVHECLNISR